MMTQPSGFGSKSLPRRGALVRFEGMGTGGRRKYGPSVPIVLDPNGPRAVVVYLHPTTKKPVADRLDALEPRELMGLWEVEDAHFTKREAEQLARYKQEREIDSTRNAAGQALCNRAVSLGVALSWTTRGLSMEPAEMAKLLDLAEIGKRTQADEIEFERRFAEDHG